MSKLSHFLRQQRERRGWSTADLATKSGVPATTLSRYEDPKSRAKPVHANILLLAAAFEMSPQDMLSYIGYPVRHSNDEAERADRWGKARELLESDPRAARILELFDEAGDEEKDTGLTILEAHFSHRRRRPRRP
jgi:transcriptional regulator with XRE-family HTH domain